MDLIIEGHPAELEWLRREIERRYGDEAELEAVPDQSGDELREPLIIALIVALGGPAIVTGLVETIKRRYDHVEEMRRIDTELRTAELAHEKEMLELRLRISDETGERDITESELEGVAS